MLFSGWIHHLDYWTAFHQASFGVCFSYDSRHIIKLPSTDVKPAAPISVPRDVQKVCVLIHTEKIHVLIPCCYTFNAFIRESRREKPNYWGPNSALAEESRGTTRSLFPPLFIIPVLVNIVCPVHLELIQEVFHETHPWISRTSLRTQYSLG